MGYGSLMCKSDIRFRRILPISYSFSYKKYLNPFPNLKNFQIYPSKTIRIRKKVWSDGNYPNHFLALDTGKQTSSNRMGLHLSPYVIRFTMLCHCFLRNKSLPSYMNVYSEYQLIAGFAISKLVFLPVGTERTKISVFLNF